MTYRDYLNEYPFETIWRRIRAIYKETQELKPLYRRLYKSVRALPKYETTEKMTVAYDSRGDVQVYNCLDTQEELVDREVEIYILEWEEAPIPEADVPAHLLWWSSMFGFLTGEQKAYGFVQWLDEHCGEVKASSTGEILDGVPGFSEKRAMTVEKWESLSLANKRLRYWRDIIIADCAYDWTWNLDILRKKIEYNIGYWKYVQRYDRNNCDIRHMQTACVMLDLAAEHCRELNGRYVNCRNSSRFGETVRSDDDDEVRDFSLRRLRCAKAKKLVWRYLDRYIQDWWD